ncbi:hypothetical protein Scep_014286 [Stephania cephalantha]|uniref:Integrase catalytic domain-containing protein n=1 Tax=Stephania cephalantha TaxID=152367 RepID=A0AAP0P1I1_9MAGN
MLHLTQTRLSTVLLTQDINTKRVLLQGNLKDGLYQFFDPSADCSNKATVQAFVTSRRPPNHIWYLRLGHPSISALQQIMKNHLKMSSTPVQFCSICPLGKHHALPFNISQSSSSHVLELIHTDVWGPAQVTSHDGFNYYIHFLDDCTRFTWLFPLKNKLDALPTFITFKNMVENQFSTKIKHIQSDWVGEFRSFKPFLDAHGIFFQHSCPHTHEQNGRAERKHKHIIETSLTLLAEANLPYKFWYDACATSVFLINRLPSRILSDISPYQKLFQQPPDYSILKVFGCACYPYKRPYNAHKYQFRSEKRLFLGYSSIHKGYKCLSKTGRMFISRHVLFDEDEFPYSTLFQNTSVSSFPPVVPHSIITINSGDQGSAPLPMSSVPSASFPTSEPSSLSLLTILLLTAATY